MITRYTNVDEDIWADACAIVDEWMNDRSSWHVEVENFGWDNRDGYKDFDADNGADLLQAILPYTACSFTLTVEDDKLLLNNAHHDKPVGGELYTVRVQEN